jgi:hypothetical protein
MEVAPPEGLEPSTHELTARCSTSLSYGGSINKPEWRRYSENLWRYLNLIDPHRS